MPQQMGNGCRNRWVTDEIDKIFMIFTDNPSVTSVMPKAIRCHRCLPLFFPLSYRTSISLYGTMLIRIFVDSLFIIWAGFIIKL
jgi:hypothetical protein